MFLKGTIEVHYINWHQYRFDLTNGIKIAIILNNGQFIRFTTAFFIYAFYAFQTVMADEMNGMN